MADNGRIELSSSGAYAKIIGGSLNTANSGLITASGVGVVLQDVTNNGNFQIPANGIAIVLGTGLTNNSVIPVNDGLSNATNAQIRFDEDGTLGGTGTVVLKGFGNTFNVATVNLAHQITNGVNHTIRGLGTFAGTGVLINNGAIIADDAGGGSLQLDLANYALIINQNNGTLKATNGGVLGFYSGTIDQSGGGVFLADGTGSIVQLGGGNPFVKVTGGTLNSAHSGVIQSGSSVLAGAITNSGTFKMPAASTTLIYASSLTNNGTMTLDASDSLLRFDQNNTSISGTGSIAMANGAVLRIADGQAVINGSSHTLKGNGNIDIQGAASLTNNGIIAPGLSPGQLNFSGNLILGSTANMFFEIGGAAQGTTYDWLNKTDGGTLTLNGNLTLRLINGFTPANSDVFTIVTTQALLAGAFGNVANGARLNTADGGGSFKVTYTVVNNALLSRNVTLSDFQPTVTARPDLTVTNITTANNLRKGFGRFITITATVANTSNAASAGSSHTLFMDGTFTVGSVATPAIAAGSSVNVSVDWRPKTFQKKANGPHTLAITADASNEVTESDETNNTSQKTVIVKGNRVR